MAKDKSGRATMIHDALDDYAKILDAVDTVTDQALGRKYEVQTGLNTLAHEERGMLQVLKQIRDSKPKDLDRYDFVLKTAIDSTNDSLDLAEQDLAKRTKDVEAREDREKKAAREAMTPAERADQKAGDQEKAAEAAKTAEQKPAQKKPPTLLRPGEKVGDQPKKQ
jgi:peptidoglycan hydrolase CwlO-like protein